MIEVWARGNNIWRQLEFSPCSSASDADGDVAKPLERVRGEEEDEEREPRDLGVYGKVFEAETVEWVRSDGFGSIGTLEGAGVFGVRPGWRLRLSAPPLTTHSEIQLLLPRYSGLAYPVPSTRN